MAERKYMRLLFGDRADKIPFISTKPVFGHTLGGSGPVNLAAGALMLHRGSVLPSYNASASHVPSPEQGDDPKRTDPDVANGVVFACGMGGLMGACLLQREEPTQR